MSRHRPTLFARLRRHRGLWVLAMAVLLIKLAGSTLCLADGPSLQAGAASQATAATQPVAAPDQVASGNGDDCVLGEGGNCHCACAHTAMLPAVSAVAAALPATNVAPSSPLPDTVPGAPASLLRPPIA